MQQPEGGLLLSQVKQLGERIFEAMLRSRGLDISGSQGRILFVLWQAGEPLPMGVLSRRTGLAGNTLTAVVDGMVGRGLLSRAQNPHNRRQVFVELTGKAWAAREEYEAVSREMNSLYYAGLTDRQVEAFTGTLRHILANLQRAEESKKEEQHA